jgi:hypothetical protein
MELLVVRQLAPVIPLRLPRRPRAEYCRMSSRPPDGDDEPGEGAGVGHRFTT